MRRLLLGLMAAGCGVDLAEMQSGASGGGIPVDSESVSNSAAASVGAGGGDHTTPWQTTCLDACETLNGCLGENICVTRLGMNCITDPEPGDPVHCVLECIAHEPMTGCIDLALWWELDAVPPPPSAFAQCVAACPGPYHPGASPAVGVAQCAIAHCQPALESCGAACIDGYDTCAKQCSDFPSAHASATDCWHACTGTFALDSIGFADLKACLCDLETQAIPSNLPAVEWSGTASCADVIAGQVGACNL